MGAPVHVLAFERGRLGVWEVEDRDLEAVRVSIHTYVGHRYMKGGGERVQTRDDEFPDSRSSIKAGG